MKATQLLIQDHDAVRGLFKRLETTKDPARCKQLFGELERMLTVHTTIEQELFYPEVKKVKQLEKLVSEALAEHRSINVMLDDFGKISASAPDFQGKLKALQDTVLHHVGEEEKEMFPPFEKACDGKRLEELGKKLETRKNELMKKLPAEV